MKLKSQVLNYQSIDLFNDIYLPISIFNNDSLSALETITKFIKEEIGISFREIGLLLNRDERTIWGAYHSAADKLPERFKIEHHHFGVPIPIIKDRGVSVLEAITEYLKEKLGLKYCQIAPLLNRNDRTIWTVYKRAKKKRKTNA